MAKKGSDLAAAGLTACVLRPLATNQDADDPSCRYMFDVLYVTWFVHVATALVSPKFWWLYLAVSRAWSILSM